ncbi:hypothetical protein GEU84_020425 [Fertoebacter nigrum]|uniref:Uncharacterized protein n=1 Tax=Fertoeibacter niger TaxID=2656921 RepID=A0A8X8KSQ0_9RHOB|nr:hypothetical protein [Fertoeibacter niger]NUB46762.1 hypothetical protein [Fertoeibacter niger]
MQTAERDMSARVKLLGGLLRLDAMRPSGFTAQDLSDHSGVKRETAREFIRECGYAEVVPRDDVSGQTVGRPARVYRLLPEGRKDVAQRLGIVRRAADGELSSPLKRDEGLFAPLILVEAILDEMERADQRDEDWFSRLHEARLELRSAEADMHVLLTQGSEHSTAFSHQLTSLQRRLTVVEQLETRESIDPSPFEPKFDPFSWLGEHFGQWLKSGTTLSDATSALGRGVVLLDGIEGEDPISIRMLDACHRRNVPVAAFDVADMDAAQRTRLFAGLEGLRTSTPLAVCDLVLTVDGRTEVGRSLACEIGELANPTRWNAIVKVADLDLLSLRQHYLTEGTSMLKSVQEPSAEYSVRKATAGRLVSALLAIEAAESASEESGIPFPWAKDETGRLRNAAKRLLGSVVCVDAQHSTEMAASLAACSVRYFDETESTRWINAGSGSV